MRIDILTVVPDLLDSVFAHSIMKRAIDKGVASVNVHDIRDWSLNKHRKVDDYAFGVGAGMVLSIEPIERAIEDLKSRCDYDQIIYMTPDGTPFDQKIANNLSLGGNLLILCGHYKGIDQRIRDNFITMELTIGDYVLTGGELAASVIVDAVVRLLPGVLNDETSALTDSFQDGLLSPPVYTRPADYKGWKVPDVLLSGDQKKVDEWRLDQAYKRTKELRPDLLDD